MLEDEDANDWLVSVLVDVVNELEAVMVEDVVDETLSVEVFTSVIAEDTEEESGAVEV